MWPFGRGNTQRHVSATTAEVGVNGEKLAKKHLRKNGLKILAQNYRCRQGEVDLIAFDQSTETIVFVEVKTRSSNEYTEPQFAVDVGKRRRLRRIAEYYISTKKAHDLNVRFDVIAVVCPPDIDPKITHIPNAF